MRQKVHLLYKLHDMYVVEHGNEFGISTFCTLRPANVLLSRYTPHETCLCQTHENFISLANALLPQYNQQWIKQNAVCQLTKTCMLNEFEACKNGIKLKAALQKVTASDDEVEVSLWQKTKA